MSHEFLKIKIEADLMKSQTSSLSLSNFLVGFNHGNLLFESEFQILPRLVETVNLTKV